MICCLNISHLTNVTPPDQTFNQFSLIGTFGWCSDLRCFFAENFNRFCRRDVDINKQEGSTRQLQLYCNMFYKSSNLQLSYFYKRYGSWFCWEKDMLPLHQPLFHLGCQESHSSPFPTSIQAQFWGKSWYFPMDLHFWWDGTRTCQTKCWYGFGLYLQRKKEKYLGYKVRANNAPISYDARIEGWCKQKRSEDVKTRMID